MIKKRQKEASKKVLLGLNGGVASCVAALLLKKQGFEVIGCSVVTNDDDQDSLDKMKAFCDALHISFHFVLGRERFQNDIIDPFIEARLSGLTSPVIANTHLMVLELLHQKMLFLEADFLATGHFAKVQKGIHTESSTLNTGVEIDKNKSHLLIGTSPEILSKCIFPMGDLTFADCLKISERFHLKVPGKMTPFVNLFDNFEATQSLINERVAKSLIHAGSVVHIDSEASYGDHEGIIYHEVGESDLGQLGKSIRKDDSLEVVGFDLKQRKVFLGSKEFLTASSAYLVELDLMDFVNTDHSLACFFRFEKQEELVAGSIYFKSAQAAVVNFEKDVYPLIFGEKVVIYDRNTRNAKILGCGVLGGRGSFIQVDRAKDFRSNEEEVDKSHLLGF